jgi:hypothetical protein
VSERYKYERNLTKHRLLFDRNVWNNHAYMSPVNRKLISSFSSLNIVAYRLVAKWWLCKQWPLLGNTRNIHTCNNRTTGLCNPILSNGSVNTFPQKRTHATIEEWCFWCDLQWGVILKKFKLANSTEWSEVKWSEVKWGSWLLGERVQLSVESQPVKRRLGGWCQMAASLGPS